MPTVKTLDIRETQAWPEFVLEWLAMMVSRKWRSKLALTRPSRDAYGCTNELVWPTANELWNRPPMQRVLIAPDPRVAVVRYRSNIDGVRIGEVGRSDIILYMTSFLGISGSLDDGHLSVSVALRV